MVDLCLRLSDNERGSYDDSRSCAGWTVNAQVRLGTAVEHQHEGIANTAERVNNEPLVEAGGNALPLRRCSSSNQQCPCRCVEQLHLETPWLSVLPQTWRRVIMPASFWHGWVPRWCRRHRAGSHGTGWFLLRAVLREHNLDRIGALLAIHARETIPDAGVARHRSVPDLRIGILGLKHKLDALNGRDECLETAPKTPTRRKSVPILRIMIDPYDLDQEDLGDEPCLKGEHHVRWLSTVHFETVSTLADVAVDAVLWTLGIRGGECEVHTKHLLEPSSNTLIMSVKNLGKLQI